MAISGDEQELFVVDNIDHEIMRLDATSLNRIAEKTIDYSAKYIMCGTGISVYVLDSTKNRLLILNGTTLETAGEVTIPGIVRAVAISSDEKQAYVAYADTAGNGFVTEINLNTRRISRIIKVLDLPSTLSLTSDNHYLYAISSEKNNGNSLFQIDSKSLKIREIRNIAHGGLLRVSPDNKKIYASCDTIGGAAQINVIDQSTLKSINSLSLNPDQICFSSDKRYILAAVGQIVYIIRADSDIIISNITLLNSSGGMVCASDGRLIVWIPKEHRAAIFDLELQAKRRIDEIEDPRLQMFKKKMNNSLKVLNNKLSIALLRTIGDSIYSNMVHFSKQLPGQYGTWGSGGRDGEYFPESDSLANVNAGISLNLDPHKRIYLGFQIKYSNGIVKIYYRDFDVNQNGQLPYQFHAEHFEYEKLRGDVNELFLQRINTHLLSNEDQK